MKLNLGCFNTRIEGFTGVDLKKFTDKVDIVVKTFYGLDFAKDESIEEIYASNVLEHFYYTDCPIVLKEWYRVLKPGGVLYVGVPDIDAAKECWDMLGWNAMIRDIFYGGNEVDFVNHKNAFNFDTLSEELIAVGFKNIERVENFGKSNDCTTCAYKDTLGNSISVSLNVIAIK